MIKLGAARGGEEGRGKATIRDGKLGSNEERWQNDCSLTKTSEKGSVVDIGESRSPISTPRRSSTVWRKVEHLAPFVVPD
jgi:hypothetical protein